MKKVYVTIGLLFDENLTDAQIDAKLSDISYSFTHGGVGEFGEEIETEGFDYDLNDKNND